MLKIVDAPKFAGMKEWDCHFCGHETLRRPAFLSDGTATYAAGRRCAAVALGLVPAAAPRESAEKAFDAADRARRGAEAAERTANALAEFAAWKAFLDGAAGPGDIFDQLNRLGGFAAARAAYGEAKAAAAP